MRALRARRAGHTPTPTVVVPDLQHAPGTDATRREHDAIGLTIERNAAVVERRHRIETCRAEANRVARMNRRARARAERSGGECSKRGRLRGGTGENEPTTRPHESLERS